MKSPHEHGIGAYKEALPFREIPMEEETLITQSYTFLGWNNSWGEETPPEYRHCVNEGHNYHSAFPNAWHSKQHNPSGSDVTQWCSICKIYWKVDMG